MASARTTTGLVRMMATPPPDPAVQHSSSSSPSPPQGSYYNMQQQSPHSQLQLPPPGARATLPPLVTGSDLHVLALQAQIASSQQQETARMSQAIDATAFAIRDEMRARAVLESELQHVGASLQNVSASLQQVYQSTTSDLSKLQNLNSELVMALNDLQRHVHGDLAVRIESIARSSAETVDALMKRFENTTATLGRTLDAKIESSLELALREGRTAVEDSEARQRLEIDILRSRHDLAVKAVEASLIEEMRLRLEESMALETRIKDMVDSRIAKAEAQRTAETNTVLQAITMVHTAVAQQKSDAKAARAEVERDIKALRDDIEEERKKLRSEVRDAVTRCTRAMVVM